MLITFHGCLYAVVLAHRLRRLASDLECRTRWYAVNRERVLANGRRYHAENRERILAHKRSPEYREWARERKRRLSGGVSMAEWHARVRVDPAVKRARTYLRNRLRHTLRQPVKVRQDRLIGCDHRQLKAWLERQFAPGMTWENYGTFWEIDHEIPLSRFDLRREDQMLLASHYTNLRPLTRHDNKVKHGRLPANAQPQLPLNIPRGTI